MLDRAFAAFHPSTLERERDDIQHKLEGLNAEREDLRLEAAVKAMENLASPDSRREREVRALHARHGAVNDEIQTLRTRRRELDRLLAPAGDALDALVSVPIPNELGKINLALEKARQDRQAAIVERQAAISQNNDKEARRLTNAIKVLETSITELRVRRTAVAVPYNAAVNEALTPIVDEASRKLLAAVTDAFEALDTLAKASEHAIDTGHMSTLVRGIGTIDRRAFAAAQSLAMALGAGAPDIEAAA